MGLYLEGLNLGGTTSGQRKIFWKMGKIAMSQISIINS